MHIWIALVFFQRIIPLLRSLGVLEFGEIKPGSDEEEMPVNIINI